MQQDDVSPYQELKSRGAKAALRLLERKPDAAYLINWTNLLARPKLQPDNSATAVIIFRLHTEWLAINCTVFCEVMMNKKIHRIPHRTNAIVRGVVNYQGMLKLCVNMHTFLTIEHQKETDVGNSRKKFSRMVSIEKDHEQWVFAVDEVQGIFHADINNLQSTPVTISKSKSNYLRGMIDWNGKNVGYIDEELLFFGLRRSML